MLQFNVDEATSDSCQVCCCEQVTLKAGVTSQLIINYATWAVPIGRLHCDPEFAIEQMAACGIVPGAPVKINGAPIAYNVPSPPLEGDFKINIEDPEGGPLVFKSVPFYEPKYGVFEVQKDGIFKYTPTPGYNGPDRFYVSATVGMGKTSNSDSGRCQDYSSVDMVETPHVSIEGYTVNYPNYFVKVAVKVAPNADKCEVWRLTARMKAIDCSCMCYDHEDCFDIRMSNC